LELRRPVPHLNVSPSLPKVKSRKIYSKKFFLDFLVFRIYGQTSETMILSTNLIILSFGAKAPFSGVTGFHLFDRSPSRISKLNKKVFYENS